LYYLWLAGTIGLICFLPYSIWKSRAEFKGLRLHGKKLNGIILEYRGANLSYQYEYKNIKYKKKVKVGMSQDYIERDSIQIVCDTLNPDISILLIWLKKGQES
jgi:hypothetical protein